MTFDGRNTGPNDTVAVRIRIPRTPPRLALGVVLVVLGVPLIWFDMITGFAVLYMGSVLLGPTEQVVSVEKGIFVVRTISPLAPNLTWRIGMDRVRGGTFELKRFPQDEASPGFRPVFGKRLWLIGDRGTTLRALGMALTLEEAQPARAALNRLLQTPGQGLQRPPAGVTDDDLDLA